jgi:hypothetical protein
MSTFCPQGLLRGDLIGNSADDAGTEKIHGFCDFIGTEPAETCLVPLNGGKMPTGTISECPVDTNMRT